MTLRKKSQPPTTSKETHEISSHTSARKTMGSDTKQEITLSTSPMHQRLGMCFPFLLISYTSKLKSRESISKENAVRKKKKDYFMRKKSTAIESHRKWHIQLHPKGFI